MIMEMKLVSSVFFVDCGLLKGYLIMPPIWKPQSKKVLQSWIDDCLLIQDKLSKWEYDFIESINDQLERRGLLSERQEEILEKIYAEMTS